MVIDGARLNLLAASLNCVAVTQTPEAGALARDLAPLMPGLMTCGTQRQCLEAVADLRPDIAIVGADFCDGDLRHMAANLKTSGMGLVIAGPHGASLAARLRANGRALRRIEIEPVDARVGAGAVILRLRALMRRCRPAALTQKHVHGAVTLDEAALTLSLGGRVAPLALDGFRILAPMFDHPDHVWTREQLLQLAYGALTANGIRTIDVKLNVTRRRLREALGCDPVRTVRGMGYTLSAEPLAEPGDGTGRT